VVTVGSFHAGSGHNIIAESAILRGTMRTFDAALRDSLIHRLREVSETTCAALGARCEFRFFPGYPATINDGEAAEFVAGLGREVRQRLALGLAATYRHRVGQGSALCRVLELSGHRPEVAASGAQALAAFAPEFTPEMARLLRPSEGMKTREIPGGTAPASVANALAEAEQRLGKMA
jgi:hypothetical protein